MAAGITGITLYSEQLSQKKSWSQSDPYFSTLAIQTTIVPTGASRSMPSSLVATPAISLNRMAVAGAIAAATLSSMVSAIAKKYTDNQMARRLFGFFALVLIQLIGWFYHGRIVRIPNNGTAAIATSHKAILQF